MVDSGLAIRITKDNPPRVAATHAKGYQQMISAWAQSAMGSGKAAPLLQTADTFFRKNALTN
jgi:hypothetical protein